MLIAEELEPNLDVPVEVVPMEELESVLESSSNGTVVTSRYFLQPLEDLAKRHGVRFINLDVRETQQAAIQLYESFGYECWGTNPNYAVVNGKKIAGHYYTKDLRKNSKLKLSAKIPLTRKASAKMARKK